MSKIPQNVTIENIRKNLRYFLDDTWRLGTRFRLTRHGKAVAALVSVEDLERLERLDAKAAARKK